MNYIYVPPITHDGEQIKPSQKYDTREWTKTNKGLREVLGGGGSVAGTEFEFVVQKHGVPHYLYNNQLVPVSNNLDKQKLNRITHYPTAERELNKLLGRENDSFQFSIELQRLTHEMSFKKGFPIHDFFQEIIGALSKTEQRLKGLGLSMYGGGNIPYTVPTIKNYSNKYYKYLYEVRDKAFPIGDFRGAGLQFHVGGMNYAETVYTYNKIRHILPLFVVLGANSPIENNIYSGYQSERLRKKNEIFKNLTGVPEKINENYLQELQNKLNRGLGTVTPYYYGVRLPRPDIKTLENCTPDMIDDIPLMFAMYDLYFRIIVKLVDCYRNDSNTEMLPQSIFGSDGKELKSVFDMSIQKGRHSEWKRGKKALSIKQQFDDILRWIEDIPTFFPKDIAQKIGLTNTDATSTIIMKILDKGNLSEQTIQEIHPKIGQMVPSKTLQQYIDTAAQKFAAQIRQLSN